MGWVRLALLAALLAPLAGAHPIHVSDGVMLDAHLVDETSGQRHHAVQRGTMIVSYPEAPLLSNRSYRLEVSMTRMGGPLDGLIVVGHNDTVRAIPVAAGLGTFHLGHPIAGRVAVSLRAEPTGEPAQPTLRLEWACLPSSGPREPEVGIERWGYTALSEWRTYNFTAEAAGYARFTLAWDDVENGPGGFLAGIHYALPDGRTGDFHAWTAFDGRHLARVAVVRDDLAAGASVDSPVSLSTGPTRVVAQGEWPAGSVVRVTQGVLNPNVAERFFVAAAADPGVLAADIESSGAMEVHGADEFRGGLQVVAASSGLGEFSRRGAVAEFVIAGSGTALIAAVVGAQGTYSWRFAGEMVTDTVFTSAVGWIATGGCGGEWWMAVDSGSNTDESFALLYLHGHRFAESIDARFERPLGTSTCRVPV